MDSKMRIVTAALFFIAIAAAAVIVFTYSENNKMLQNSEAAANANATYSDFAIFSENGHFGVKNEDDEIVIDAKWDYLYSLGFGNYIAGETRKGVMYYGAVDIRGSICIPIVYAGIDIRNSEILCAKTFDGKYAIYDIGLQSFSHKEFSNFLENPDGTYTLTEKDISYTVFVYDKTLKICKLSLNCNIHTTAKLIEIIPENPLSFTECADYIDIVNESCDYIEALFYGENLEKYSNELLDDSVLLGESSNASKVFVALNSLSTGIFSSDDGIHYTVCAAFTYDVPVNDFLNSEEYIYNRYEVNADLAFEKQFDGTFKLISCVFSNS